MTSHKRKIKQNIYGNWRGYVAGKSFIEFGSDGISAAYWFLTGIVDFYAGYADDCIKQCKKIAISA